MTQEQDCAVRLDMVTTELKGLLGSEYVSDDYLIFRIEFAQLQTLVAQELTELIDQPQVAHDAPAVAGVGGDPAHPAVMVPPSTLASAAANLRQLLLDRPNTSSAWTRLGQAVDAGEVTLMDLARGAWPADRTARLPRLSSQLGIPEPELALFTQLLLAPFAAFAAKRKGNQQLDAASKEQPNRCPFCQSEPALAVLQLDDGKRRMHCGLCGEQWAFPRLRCPYCSDEGSSAIETIIADNSHPFWLEACSSCRGYVKTIDQRRYPPGTQLIPYVLDSATLFLDLLAERKGLRAHPGYAPMR